MCSCCWDCTVCVCVATAREVTSYPLIDRPRNYRCVWSPLVVSACRGSHGTAAGPVLRQKFESVNDLKEAWRRLICPAAGRRLWKKTLGTSVSDGRGIHPGRSCCNWFHAAQAGDLDEGEWWREPDVLAFVMPTWSSAVMHAVHWFSQSKQCVDDEVQTNSACLISCNIIYHAMYIR